MGMLEVFCRGIGEPTVVAVLLLLPVAFWQKIYACRKESVLVWSVVIGIMLGWRVGIGIISSRYATVLVLPLLFIIVVLADYVQKKLKWGLVRRLPYVIPMAIVVVLAVFYIAKLGRINTARNYLPEGCDFIRQRAAAFRAPLVLSLGERDRIAYYSGMSVLPLDDCPAGVKIGEYLAEQAASYHGCADAVLVGMSVRKESLPELEQHGGRIVYRKFTNKHKHRVFVIIEYSGLPLYTGAKMADEPFTAAEPILWQDGFEKGEANDPDNLHNRLRLGKRLFFFRDPDLTMPVEWRPYIYYRPIFTTESRAEFELINRAVSGKYSLRMKAERCIMLEHKEYLHFPARQIEIKVRGMPGSRFALIVNQYEKWSYAGVWAERNFWVADAQLNTYSLPVSGCPADYKIGIVLHQGEIIVDDVILR